MKTNSEIMAEAEVTLVTIIDKLSSYNLYVAGANFGLNYLLSHFVKLREREGHRVDSASNSKVIYPPTFRISLNLKD